MDSFKIVTDTTADLPEEYLKEKDIPVFHLPYTILETTYGKNNNLPYKDFYRLMREGNVPKTSQVNPEEAKAGFLEILKTTDRILYLAFSSGLSGTYNSARIAAEEIMEENKDVKIIVIDSKCASMGEGLFVYKAQKLKEEGKSMEEVAEWLSDHVLNFVHVFTVDDLNYLYRGGRVSKTTAVVATVLDIKPVLHVDDEGHLINVGKVRNRKKSLIKLVDMMEGRIGSYKDKNDIFFVSHGDCVEDAEFVRDEVMKRFGIKNCMINNIGPTIGAHSGPGTVALFFLGDFR